jgi:biopolymer transport protein TolR
MAIQLPGRSSGMNGHRGRYRPLAEINVTPLVDVMLVLLIIFMVTAPLMTSGVTVDLPKTSSQPLNTDSQPLTVSINAEGQIYLQNEQVDLSELVAKLQAIAQNNPDRRIFVRGDKANTYGRIMEVMGTITEGGFTKVALLAEQPTLPAPGGASGGAPAAPSGASAPAKPATPAPAPARSKSG